MKVLVLGGGGREHALAWKIAQSPLVESVHASPGNPGIAKVASCHPCLSGRPEEYLALAKSLHIDLTVVGPEAPLVAGVVDVFRAAGMAIVGPTAVAAKLEGSKAFSKAFMQRAGIPTARFTVAASQSEALVAIANFDYPLVLKVDGLAAGKGVVIAQHRAEAEAAIRSMLSGENPLPHGRGSDWGLDRQGAAATFISGEIFGHAGARIVIEEFLNGEEVSFIVLTDGGHFVAMEPSQDHKAIFDGDKGPNTGGMGAYCASGILTPAQTDQVIATVINPTLHQMAAEGKKIVAEGQMAASQQPRPVQQPETAPDLVETPVPVSPKRSDVRSSLIKSSSFNPRGSAYERLPVRWGWREIR